MSNNTRNGSLANAQILLAVDSMCSLFFSMAFPRFLLHSSLEESNHSFLEISVFMLIASKIIVYYSLAPCGDDFTLVVSRGVKGVGFGTFVFYVTAVLFGAPVIELIWGTILLSALISGLVVCPVALLCTNLQEGISNACIRVYARMQPDTMFEVNLLYTGIGTLIGSWLGAIPIPLDWDRPWQAWPITIVYGALFGYTIGVLFAAFWPGMIHKGETTKQE